MILSFLAASCKPDMVKKDSFSPHIEGSGTDVDIEYKDGVTQFVTGFDLSTNGNQWDGPGVVIAGGNNFTFSSIDNSGTGLRITIWYPPPFVAVIRTTGNNDVEINYPVLDQPLISNPTITYRVTGPQGVRIDYRDENWDGTTVFYNLLANSNIWEYSFTAPPGTQLYLHAITGSITTISILIDEVAVVVSSDDNDHSLTLLTPFYH
jgi:hypothetical protein